MVELLDSAEKKMIKFCRYTNTLLGDNRGNVQSKTDMHEFAHGSFELLFKQHGTRKTKYMYKASITSYVNSGSE